MHHNTLCMMAHIIKLNVICYRILSLRIAASYYSTGYIVAAHKKKNSAFTISVKRLFIVSKNEK